MTKRFHISKLKPSALQGRLDFDAVAKRQSAILALEHPAERLLRTALFIMLGLLVCSYFYFVVGSVLNVVARKSADASAANLQEQIGNLESEYFSLSQSLTPSAAASLGLTPIKETQYVYRPGNAAAVASADRAI